MLAIGCANVPELVGLTFINMSYNDFILEQLNFIRTHWDYSELCQAIKKKNGSNR